MPNEVNLGVNSDVKHGVAVTHLHDEAMVQMTRVTEPAEEHGSVGPTRTTHAWEAIYECPQCHTRAGVQLETIVDTIVDASVDGEKARTHYSAD